MRRLSAPTFAALLLATLLPAAEPKECVDLSAAPDRDVSSPSGIRVTVSGRNHCPEDLNGSQVRFEVKALGSGGSVLAAESGTFDGTIPAHGTSETKIFLLCDPERVRTVAIAAK